MTLAHTYHLRTDGDHFQFGWEMGRIARALVTGYGYADPFIGHTGPTTWVPPLYPLLIAGVFKLFGIYTLRSAWVLLAINSFFSALTTLTTYEIAARCFNRRVAVVVCMDLGSLSRRHAICRSLGLGDDAEHLAALADFGARLTHAAHWRNSFRPRPAFQR